MFTIYLAIYSFKPYDFIFQNSKVGLQMHPVCPQICNPVWQQLPIGMKVYPFIQENLEPCKKHSEEFNICLRFK